MRRPPFRLSLLSICSVVILLFYGVDCSPDKDEPEEPDQCGAFVDDYYSHDLLNVDPADRYMYLDNGYAYYDYSAKLVSDVCAYKHVTGTISIGIYNDYKELVDYSAEVVYGVLYAYPIDVWEASEFTYYGTKYEGEYEFGMKHLYEDEPGWFLPTVTILIKDQGTPEKNHELFQKAIGLVHYRYKYYKIREDF